MKIIQRPLVADVYNNFYVRECIHKYKKTIRDNKVENKEAIEAKHEIDIYA
jgi:hypothetical protein